MPKVLISNIVDNEYRKRDLFPTDPTKIASLVESIDQTGFWDNILVRFHFNELADGTVIDGVEQLAEIMASGIDLSQETLELAYGHHRLDALIEAGYTEIDIPVKFITDEDMMRIMANENKEGWGGSIKSILETVRQVHGRLTGMFSEYTGYADYVATVGDKVMFSKKQFRDAKANGVGYRTVQTFLGDSWNPTDVRIPLAVFKAVEKGYFTQQDIFDFPTLGILDSFTACVVAMFEGGKIKEKVEVEKKDKEGKTVRDEAGDPVMVKTDKFVTVAAPNWPVAFKEKMVAALVKQCIPAGVKDDNEEETYEYVKETLLTQSEMNKRRVNMLKKQSAPTTGGVTVFRLRKEIIRQYFPGFDPQTPDEEREKLHAQLVGKDMATFIDTDGIKGWSLLEEMVGMLKDAFECLLTPLSESEVDDLQSEMDSEAGTSEEFESDYKDLEIVLDEKDEEGNVVETPIGQISRDVVDLLSVSVVGIDGLTLRASEINLEADELLNSALRIAIAKTCMLYAGASSVDDLGFLLKETLESVVETIGEEVAPPVDPSPLAEDADAGDYVDGSEDAGDYVEE